MYKLVLLDYSMSEMDGPKVSIEMRQIIHQEDVKQPYICCCTAYAEASYQR